MIDDSGLVTVRIPVSSRLIMFLCMGTCMFLTRRAEADLVPQLDRASHA
jgi:hypothetical protein